MQYAENETQYSIRMMQRVSKQKGGQIFRHKKTDLQKWKKIEKMRNCCCQQDWAVQTVIPWIPFLAGSERGVVLGRIDLADREEKQVYREEKMRKM